MTPFTREVWADAVIADSRGELLEGPIWEPDTQTALWVDLFNGTVHSCELSSRRARLLADFGEAVGLVAPTTAGEVVAVTASGIHALAPDGAHRLVTAVEERIAARRPNDGACDPGGHLWFSTVDVEHADGEGRLYRWDGQRAEVVADGFTLPNGMDWTPDGDRFYLVDSLTRTVWAWRWDAGWPIGEPEPFLRLAEDDGLPDGLTVDAEGCVWIAVFDRGAIRRYTPRADLDGVVRFPVSRVTSCAFVGEHLDQMLVTTASRDLSAVQRQDQPQAGMAFLADVGASGIGPRLLGPLPHTINESERSTTR